MRILESLLCLVFLFGGTTALGARSCVLSSNAKPAVPAVAGVPGVPGVNDDIDEIQAACDGLLVEQDSSRLKKEAFGICCQGADSFVKKEPIPPRSGAAPSVENLWARYRVRLALDVCDAIRPSELGYQKNLCLTEMLFRIPDPRVTAILDECSPIGHNAGGGRSHGRGGHGAAGGATPPAAQASSAEAAPKPHASNLLLSDESFSKCQHEKLEAFLRRLDDRHENGDATPPAADRAEGSFHRHSTSASPRSAQTTE